MNVNTHTRPNLAGDTQPVLEFKWSGRLNRLGKTGLAFPVQAFG